MRNQGLGSWPERRMRISPDKVAVRFEGQSTTYAEWGLRTRRTAHALRSMGVARGDRVAYLGFNHPACLDTLFACGQLGAVYVPLNARLSVDELAFIIDDSGSTALLYGRDHAEHALELSSRLIDLQTVMSVETPDGTRSDLDAAVASAPDTALDIAVAPEDICLLMYTSGTTGHPKGVMLTHDNMIFNAMNQILSQDITSHDVALSVAPLFHIGGIGGAVTPVLMHGGTIVLERGFDAGTTLATIRAESVTTFFAVPTIIDLMHRHPDFASADLSKLRSLSVGGAPLPEVLIGPWLERGVDILQVYGMTETSPSATLLSGDDAERRIGSAGKMCFFSDIDVVDTDDRTVAPGVVGEVVISGRNVMRGYWNNVSATEEAVRDDWMHTGDAGQFDEDGFLYIRDRFKDMYISGGENVYPAEVENALLRHPGIVEAAVIGVPDDRWGESGIAFVVPSAGSVLDSTTLRAEMRASLAPFKIPREIIVRNDLPRTGSGKIRKTELHHLHSVDQKDSIA